MYVDPRRFGLDWVMRGEVRCVGHAFDLANAGNNKILFGHTHVPSDWAAITVIVINYGNKPDAGHNVWTVCIRIRRLGSAKYFTD